MPPRSFLEVGDHGNFAAPHAKHPADNGVTGFVVGGPLLTR